MKKQSPKAQNSRLTSFDPDLVADTVVDLPPKGRMVLKRLFTQVAARGGELPMGMLEDIRAIAIEGADSAWQVERLQQIMDRWLRSH